jgi:hypothetical protein
MSLLRELADIRQVPGEPRRRWFSSPDLDLIVWLDDTDTMLGFQLCYDKSRGERALTWRADRGYEHAAVDDGEARPSHKETPILVANGHLNRERVADLFREASVSIPPRIRDSVADLINRSPD